MRFVADMMLQWGIELLLMTTQQYRSRLDTHPTFNWQGTCIFAHSALYVMFRSTLKTHNVYFPREHHWFVLYDEDGLCSL
jgi:hypothetical protein